MARPTERLTVHNFGPIKRLDLTVSPFTIVIGPQSVGKSLTAKLLYFFQNIPRYLLRSGLDENQPSPEEVLAQTFGELFPVPFESNGPCSITYKLGRNTVNVEFIDDPVCDWSVTLPAAVKSAFSSFREHLEAVALDGDSASSESDDESEEDAVSIYEQQLAAVFPDNHRRGLFIPAGRAFYAQVQANMASFFHDATLDPFVSDFGVWLASSKKRSRLTNGKRSTGSAAHFLEGQLLGGQFLRENNRDYIVTTDGRRIPAKLWSSGQQEAQPLVFLLQHYSERSIVARPLFIEEPEAHLFPSSQRSMTELIALAFENGQPSPRIFLTTHSPYILVTINNLLLAGQIYTANPTSKVKRELIKTVPADRALTAKDVGAFFMDQNGCRSILDKETGLIEASAIDEVSIALNETFESLLDLQNP